MIIEIWYDHQFKSWIIQKKDNEGFQLEDVEYHGNKQLALNEIPNLQKEHPKAMIKVFGRDGSLQKTI